MGFIIDKFAIIHSTNMFYIFVFNIYYIIYNIYNIIYIYIHIYIYVYIYIYISGLSMNGIQLHLHAPTHVSIYLGMPTSRMQNFI